MEDKHSTLAPSGAGAPDGEQHPRQATSLRFGSVAAVIGVVAKAEGLRCPAFRSPPGLVGVSRSIRRRRDGRATVAVALRGRPWAAVLADMVEGVVAANRLRGVPADRARARLWEGLGAVDEGHDDAQGTTTSAARGDKISDRQSQDRRTEPNASNGEKAQGFAA